MNKYKHPLNPEPLQKIVLSAMMSIASAIIVLSLVGFRLSLASVTEELPIWCFALSGLTAIFGAVWFGTEVLDQGSLIEESKRTQLGMLLHSLFNLLFGAAAIFTIVGAYNRPEMISLGVPVEIFAILLGSIAAFLMSEPLWHSWRAALYPRLGYK